MIRDFKQDKIFLANAIAFVPSTVLLVLLAKTGSGAMAFAWSRVAAQAVMACVLIAVVPRHYRPGLTRSALSVTLRFGIPLAGANLVNYTLLNVDYAFVGHLLGAARLGVYMLAFTLASAPYSLLGAVINNVSMPAFSRVKHDPALLKTCNGHRTARSLFDRTTDVRHDAGARPSARADVLRRKMGSLGRRARDSFDLRGSFHCLPLVR